MTSPTGSPNPADSSLLPFPGFFTRAFASALFTGYAPIASGTVASALALAIYFIPGFEGPYIIMPACFIAFLAGIRSADAMEAYYGHDPSEVTIDEVVGMWLSLFLLPKSVVLAVAAFFLFRLFDIIKPYPAAKFDKLEGGFGIMMDDVIAGFYTNLVLHFLAAIPAVQKFMQRIQG